MPLTIQTIGVGTVEDDATGDTARVGGIKINDNFAAVKTLLDATEAAVPAVVSDTAYDATSWNGVTTIAPSKNAVRDKIESLAAEVIPTSRGGTNLTVAPTNSGQFLRSSAVGTWAIATLTAGDIPDISGTVVSDTAYAGSWDGVTAIAPSKNAVYDRLEAMKPESFVIACSDETTALTTGTSKAVFRMPYAFTLTAVRASVTTAPTGANIIVDINETGTGTILSTRITIDATEKTSTTAAAPVISDTALADDAEITIDIDQIGSTIAGAGLKVVLIGYKT